MCQDAGYALIEFKQESWTDNEQHRADQATRRAGLCFGQQMLLAERANYPRNAFLALDELLGESGHE